MSTAFVFPGQGSQSVGMGRDVYEESAAARAIFEQADAVLGFGLTRLCFEGPEQELTATENAQPALLATSVALLSALAGDAEIPTFTARHASFVAGHSLGEYTALVAAGALDLPTALRLVRRRGELMAATSAGAMAAIIGMDEAMLAQICGETSSEDAPVVIANDNAPGQLVISGATAAVERAVALAKERGARRALPLKVSGAFHSPLMREAAAGMAQMLATASIADPRVPVIANVGAQPLVSAESIRRELAEQVTGSVQWSASVRAMAESGVDTFVEIGPGSVLTGLIRRIAPAARLINVGSMAQAREMLRAG